MKQLGRFFLKTIRFELLMLSFWMVFFFIFRIVFFLYHKSIYSQFQVSDLFQSVWKGMYMDLSMSSYLIAFPMVIWSLGSLIGTKRSMKWLTTYQLLLLFLVSLLISADMEIFNNWGHRIDSAIIPYLRYPNEAIASSLSSPVRILFTFFGLGFMIPIMFWFGYTKPNISNLWFESDTKIFVGLFATALLIIPIRGGFQLIPMNQSSVYFSNIRSINQATENPIWVLFQSILEEGDAKNLENIHIKFKTESADSLYNELYPQKTERTNYLISCPKPNVVIIVWESLTAKVSSGFGGKLSCTPNLDNIGREGIKFTNFYATGDRSDKGLAAILSSVPAIGKKSIMADPIKVSRLPFLVQDMKRAGYKTSYIYGGELEFANMKNFMIESGFQRIIGKDDFPKKALNSKWGAHDEIVFDKQIELANAEREPFFHTLFTLSSHEPFEFPGQKRKESDPVDSLFCHAHKYTDGCVGRWFEKVKKTAWWKNTLVIIVADHGHSRPGISLDNNPWKFKIPMVWTGGCLKPDRPNEITKLGNQTDLSLTLLEQLHLKKSEFRFSRNLLDSNYEGFTFFAYRNGNGFLRQKEGRISGYEKEAALYSQKVYQDLYQKK